MDVPAVAFDLTPLQNAHRHRGIGTYVRGLARRLAAQHDLPIEFWARAGPLPFYAPAPHRVRRLPALPSPTYRGAWIPAKIAMKIQARRSAVQVVHVNDPDALTPLSGCRLVATVYDLIPLRLGIPMRRLIGWTGYQAYLWALRRVDVYLAISQATAADLGALLHVPSERIRLAVPGIDLQPSIGGSAQQSRRPYFLFLGGPNPNKNLSVLLEAMVLCPELPEELVIAGYWLPAQQAQLDARLDILGLRGRVRHAGFVPGEQLASVMKQATALVMPSRVEGFGLPIGEGLAAGAAVLHSRIPVLEETSAGAAVTFDPGSPTELAECLRKISGDEDLSRELRRRGRERAAELSWDGAVATALATYREMAGG